MNNLKKNRWIIISILFIILLYMIRIYYPTVSIDTEKFINDPNSIITSWYSIGRFSLGIYIKILNLLPLNIRFNNIVSLALYILATLLLIKDLNKGKQNAKVNTIMFLLILTSPLLAEQYAFTLQNLEVALSYLFLIIVMKCMNKAIYNKKYAYLIATPLLVLIFGTYQSFYLMYISLTIIYFIENFNENNSLKENLKIIGIYVSIFITYGILTIIVGNLINNVLDIKATGYLTEQMNWFNGNFVKGILYCGYYFVSVLFGLGVDNNLGYSILIVFFLLYFKKNWNNHQILYNLSLISLLFSPFLLSVVFGTVTFSRAQFSIPIIMSYLYGRNLNKKKFFVVSIYIILIQFIGTFYLFKIDLERYNNDYDLIKYIENIENDNNLPIIFVGNTKYQRLLSGEVLGKSFYNWDYKSDRLSNDRIEGFSKVYGFNYEIPSTNQIIEVKNNIYKYKKFINYDDEYIVINLNNYIEDK